MEFKKKMNDLKEVDPKAYEWLLNKPPTEWTKSHFRETVKCDMLLNNLCEGFNAAILGAREKPIVTLLERIRFWLMCRFRTNREAVQKWVHPIGKRILSIIEKHKLTARHCMSTNAGNGKFQVTVHGVETLVVDLVNKKCTCRGFQLTGIPCPHALACIWASGMNLFDYIDDWYKREAYEAAYAGIIEPMPSPDKWPDTGMNPILPPTHNTLPGRPKKKRNRGADEPPPPDATKTRRTGQPNHCTNCKQRGHSRRTCVNPTYTEVNFIFMFMLALCW